MNIEDINPAEIAAKRAAGLTKEQAITVILEQAEHDATDPHDPPPGEPKPKGKKAKDAA